MREGKYKCSTVKMNMKLRDQQLKTITYLNRLLYINPMVSTNQKSVKDTHTLKRRNPNIALEIGIKSQEKRTKEEGKKKDLQKQIQNK